MPVLRGLYLLPGLADRVSFGFRRTAYFSVCHSHLPYAILVWVSADRPFGIQRMATRIMARLEFREDCGTAFVRLEIFTIPFFYILKGLLYVRSNLLTVEMKILPYNS